MSPLVYFIGVFQFSYSLPDGSRLELGNCRFRAAEVLFRPELIGEECPGLAYLVNDSIRVFVF